MCHFDAYTDQALAAKQQAICIIMEQDEKICALFWCISDTWRADGG